MEETITKRLHVSGLTPAITPADLSRRLTSFGTVKALDGFGLLDGVDLPRKFGYVTLETTKKNLGRCMNLLSGATWKGAKLRIGEAKPDFRERIAQEHAALKRASSDSDSERPRKRRRLPKGVHGLHAADMSLVTPENVASRPAWRVTPLGRLVRPIRMRPEHPLPAPLLTTTESKSKKALQKVGRKKKRVKEPPTRARRRTIDPTKWGSQHLKGVFLDSVTVAEKGMNIANEMREVEEVSGTDEPGGGDETQSEEEELPVASVAQGPKDNRVAHITPRQIPSAVQPPAPRSAASNVVPSGTLVDLTQEKKQSLDLLQVLFGNKRDAEWGEKESVGSDIEIGIDGALQEENAEDEDQIEEAEGIPEIAMAVDADKASDVERVQPERTMPSAPVQKAKLKDLFAPREDDAQFSLLGHLDLDLELDDEVDLYIPTQIQQPRAEHQAAALSAPPPALSTLDPKRPLFFPLPPDERGRERTRDVLDPTNWRTWFFRTDSAEDIQKRWEETKGELTSGWKRRHREAVKSRRRRGGGPGETEP